MKNDVFSEFATFLTNKHQNRPKRIEKRRFHRISDFFDKKKNTKIDQNVLNNDVFSEYATFMTKNHTNRPKRIEKRCFQRICNFFDQKTPT